MQTILTLKWETHGNPAEHLISKAGEHLDKRKKHLKDDTVNRDVLTAILAQRGGPFEVRYTLLPKNVREAVREAIEGLCGPVLLSMPGTTTYALKDDWKAPEARFITKPAKPDGKRAKPTITTTYGTIYRDGSHGEVPFENVALLGYSKPSLVTVDAPHHHWHMFMDGMEAPSRNWSALEEIDAPHPSHETLMDMFADNIINRGVVGVRHGTDSFLTINPDAVVQTIDTTLIRFTNKVGQRPLLTVTDTYGRKIKRWGSKASAGRAA